MKFSLRRYSSGTLYVIFHPLVLLVFRMFFRKLYIHNRHAVPAAKPVLVASNHPTAFIDPLLLCCFLNPPLYNMTRGDIFRKPFFRKLLEEVNMFPVFRHRDGYNSRDRNDEVFDFCIERLHTNHAVGIYVEGEHHSDKRLRPLQKGLARIAFGAYEQYRQPDLQIVPAGCNYAFADRPRDIGMVNIGQPIFVRDYWELYQQNSASAIKRLNEDIEKALLPLCYHIADPADDVLAEQLLTLHRSDNPNALLPVVVFDGKPFLREKKILDDLTTLSVAAKAILQERAGRYFETLKHAGLNDAALANPGWGRMTWLVFLVGAWVPFVVGYIARLPVLSLALYISGTKVQKKEFYGSVFFGVEMLGGLVYFLLLLGISFFVANPYLIALVLLTPLLGWFSVFYGEIFTRWRAARAAAAYAGRAELLSLRSQLTTPTSN